MMTTNDIDLVEEATQNKGSLYLGNLDGAWNIKRLNQLDIKHVVSILVKLKGLKQHYHQSDIAHKVIEVHDSECFDIYPKLYEAADYIESSLLDGNVLVHCAGGISRSPACVIAYYIRHRNKTYDEALQLVKYRRPLALPNTGFQKHLKQFEEHLSQQNN